MLRFLASLSPVLVLLLGAAPAAVGTWAIGEAKHALIDAPEIRQTAELAADAKCSLRVTLVAQAAEKAERERQQAIKNDVLTAYRAALTNSERLAAEAAKRLDQEIADYEIQLLEQGRFCGVSLPDIEFMYGRDAAGAAVRR